MTNRRVLNFINGAYTEGTSGKTFENRNPVDNSVVSVVHEAGKVDIDAAVRAAQAAIPEWSRIPVLERSKLLYAVAAEIDARAEEFIEAEILDTGKPYKLASHLDIPRGAANFRIFADVVKNVPGEYFEMPTPDGKGAINTSIRVPKGVVAVICPWNLPLLLMTWKVGPALACGNAVIVKPSEETPSTAALLGDVMNKVGIPKGIYNVVHGFGPDSAGEFLVSHPGVNAITFTGETRTGEVIMKSAAVGIRDISMELGGKNPAVVFADADLDAAMAGLGRSCFENTGQVCLGTERIYVERPIYKEFVERLKAKAESLAVGDPKNKATDMGPLISVGHREKVLSYYEKAKREGATIVTGGGVPKMGGDFDNGAWVQPTIWTGLPENSPVIREEIFGPCTHVTPFDKEADATRMANDTPYGLCTSIWTQDISRANRVAREIYVGLSWINTWFLRDLRTPFGGAKQSGIGREGGVHSLEFYTETRNICVKL